MNIQENRLWNHIQELGMIGRAEDGSVTRLPFTKEDQQAETLLLKWMREAGLDTRVDAVGNVIGIYSGREPELPPVVCGSHFDSVVEGGIFDGCLGVLAGIEVLQTMKKQGIRPKRTHMVIGFRDEEGNRFGYGMVGSKSFCGVMGREGFQSTDANGYTLQEAMELAGFHPEDYTSCQSKAHRYYELHIEQGRILEDQDTAIGIVSGISALTRYTITFKGESAHAGATAMKHRIDPVVAMSAWISEITRLATLYPDTTATIGEIHTYPGACNIICDHVTCSLDIRSLKGEHIEEIMKKMEEFHKQSNSGVVMELQLEQHMDACPSDHEVITLLDKICKEQGIPVVHLASGAGHDAMNFKNVCPIGMIFVRSVRGYSHRKEEYSRKEDCALGCELLYQILCHEGHE